MGEHYDALETRDPEVRERALFAALPAQIAHAKSQAPYYTTLLAEVEAADTHSRESLATLPVTRKSALHEMQKANMPFAGINATAPGRLARLFVSPGPIYDVEAHGKDYWGSARTLFAAGFRAGNIVHNTFSYHLTPAGSMFETGAHALGCAVIPAGVGQTEMQLATMAALRPEGYAGTPSFLKLLVEKADEMNVDISSLRRAVLSGEAFLPPVRQTLNARGIETCEAYGTADLGMIAYESAAHEGLILNENLIVEIVRPGTGEPVAEGEVGEVVVTNFNRDYPMVRLATGDLSTMIPGLSSCGRTNRRIRGWMGRADQATKVRGMFVHPHQVAEIIRRHPQIVRARLVVNHVDGSDAMTLHCEFVVGTANERVHEQIVNSIREVTKLRGEVEAVARGNLPNDGKVIEDRRTYA